MKLISNLRLTLLYIVFIGLTGMMGFAQQITLTGTVYEYDEKGEKGEPLAGVNCSVASQSVGAISDDDGVFKLKLEYAPEVKVKLHLSSYIDTTVTVKLDKESATATFEFGMLAEGINIGTQVITAGQHVQDLDDVTGSITVVNQKQVDYQASNEIEDVLQQTSGVTIIDGQPNIRGSSGYAYGVGSRVMVMLDGLPLLAPHAAFAQFDLIPMDNISQIEVLKGASSVLYGSSALGGVINVITKDAPETPLTSVRLTGTYFGAPKNPLFDWDGNKGAMVGSFNIFHTRRWGGNNDFTLLIGGWKDTGYRQDTEAEEGRILMGMKFRPKSVPGLTLGFDASARADSGTTYLYWDGYIDDSVNTNGDTVQFGRTLIGDETLRRQINTRFTFDPQLKFLTAKNNLHQYRGRIMRVSNKNDTGQDNANWMFFNNYQYLTHFWNQRFTWISGVTLQYNTIQGDSLFGGNHWSFNGAGYMQVDGNLNENLKASLGGRFDYFDIDGVKKEMAPIFRAGLNYKFAEGTNVRASFGQAFRSPSIAERYTSTSAGGLLVAPNPDLKVEKGFSAEIGFRQGFLFGTKKKGVIGFLDLAGFVMDFKNMIEFGINGTTTTNPFDPDFAPIFSAVNISRATIPGAELTGMASITLNKFTIDLSGGITYLSPFNPDAVPDSVQVDLYNTEGPNAIQELFAWLEPEGSPNKKYDNPEFLKYRSKWTHVATVALGYGKFSFTTNFRAQSQIVNVDQVLYLAINGAREWRRDHTKGYKLFDFILGYDIKERMNLSFLVKNAFNEEYVLLPGIMEKQRQFALQYKWVF